jgi:cation-transporting P-type ATPase E
MGRLDTDAATLSAEQSASRRTLSATPDTGLPAAEVDARRAKGLGNKAAAKSGRSYFEIVRENVFTFTNNIMFLLGVGLMLVGRPLDALISVSVVGTNVVVGVAQEIRAKRTLDRISLLTRPTAAVIRDGKMSTVGPEELVVGDLVEIGSGDQIVLDGQLVSGRLQADESQLTGESDLIGKGPGERVFSGSFCVTGRGRYVVEHVGAESLANRITQGAKAFRRVLTPLQHQVNSVIRVALLIVIYMELLLLVTSIARVVPTADAVGQAAVLAGLIPNGLFVSIAIAYALGAVRLVRFGALIQQANAVESLSRVDVLCTDKTGTLTANRLKLRELVPLGTDEDGLRHIAGTVVASAGERNKTAEAIAAACPADALKTSLDVPFSSVRKWSAVAFSDGELRGTYAIGAPQFLAAGLEGEAWASIEPQVAERAALGLRVLLLIAHDDPAVIGGTPDDALLGIGYRPLGLIVLEDELRPHVGAILEQFAASGVRIKIISGDDPDTVVALARQAGLTGELPSVSGADLDAMDDPTLAATARRTVIFGRITPAQKERLVVSLRSAGDFVAMIGDGVNDVLSMKKSDLAVAMASGSQATRSVADIVLTEDSFAALAPAVQEGQRILNGMFDILGLFLARIATMGLIILSSLVIGIFPIPLRPASAITLFSVGVPAALLAIWAQPGPQTHDSLGRTILRFVLPAAMLSSLLGLTVFYLTLYLTVTAHGPIDGLSAADQTAAVNAALPLAQSALTAFLVMVGLGLIVFVEPPTEWLAVVQERSPDWRPTGLAIGLAVGFVILVVAPPLRDIFGLTPLGLLDWALVLGLAAVWFVALRTIFHHRVVERFVGA